MKNLIFYILLVTSLSCPAQVPRNCSQAIIGIAKDWNSSHVTLSHYQKRNGQWQMIGKSWQGRLGKKGLAWGRGLHKKTPKKPFVKREGDWRAPAGIFKIGGAYGYANKIKKSPLLSYRKITPKDLWVEDPNSAKYNQHIILNHLPATRWEKNAQMKQNDYAHALKLYIAHNDAMLGGKPIPGLGSSIFFHIWRKAGKSPSAGCTTMSKMNLKQLTTSLVPNRNPVYILLPQSEYSQLRKSWKLP